jgi:hypothetical protein
MTTIVLMVIISLEAIDDRWKKRQQRWAQLIVIILLEQEHNSKKWLRPHAQLVVIVSLEATLKLEKKTSHLGATTQF